MTLLPRHEIPLWQITLFVLGLHFAFLSSLFLVTPEKEILKKTHKLTVRTVKLSPKISPKKFEKEVTELLAVVEQKETPSELEVSTPTPEKPPVPEKPKEQKESPKPPVPAPKQIEEPVKKPLPTYKPSPPPPPKPILKPIKPSPKPAPKMPPKLPVNKPAPNKETPKEPSKPAAPSAQEIAQQKKKQELLAKVQGNLTQISKKNSSSSSSAAALKLPSEITSLHSDSLTIEEGSFSVAEKSYKEELAARLKHLLKLPEFGLVKIKLTLSRVGKVVKVEILSAESALNKKHIEKSVPNLTLPTFGNNFGNETSHTFQITLSND